MGGLQGFAEGMHRCGRVRVNRDRWVKPVAYVE